MNTVDVWLLLLKTSEEIVGEIDDETDKAEIDVFKIETIPMSRTRCQGH